MRRVLALGWLIWTGFVGYLISGNGALGHRSLAITAVSTSSKSLEIVRSAVCWRADLGVVVETFPTHDICGLTVVVIAMRDGSWATE